MSFPILITVLACLAGRMTASQLGPVSGFSIPARELNLNTEFGVMNERDLLPRQQLTCKASNYGVCPAPYPSQCCPTDGEWSCCGDSCVYFKEQCCSQPGERALLCPEGTYCYIDTTPKNPASTISCWVIGAYTTAQTSLPPVSTTPISTTTSSIPTLSSTDSGIVYITQPTDPIVPSTTSSATPTSTSPASGPRYYTTIIVYTYLSPLYTVSKSTVSKTFTETTTISVLAYDITAAQLSFSSMAASLSSSLSSSASAAEIHDDSSTRSSRTSTPSTSSSAATFTGVASSAAAVKISDRWETIEMLISCLAVTSAAVLHFL